MHEALFFRSLMSKLPTYLFYLLLCLLAVLPEQAHARAHAAATHKGSLQVRVDGLNPLIGTLYVSVCREEEFLTENCSYTKKMSAKTNQVLAVFNNLPSGDYAVQVHHDLNNNAKMDYNWLGIPEEPFGFSHITSISGRPSFTDASVHFDNEEMTVTVKLLRLSGL